MVRFFNKSALNPKGLFLADGLGAFLAAFLLFAMLRNWSEYVGMPKPTLTILSLIALLFCLYSFGCFLLVHKNWPVFLRILVVANSLYACLTVGLAMYNFPHLTTLGVTYFVGELLVLSGLVFFEMNFLTLHKRG